jgi:hypothetical protein
MGAGCRTYYGNSRHLTIHSRGTKIVLILLPLTQALGPSHIYMVDPYLPPTSDTSLTEPGLSRVSRWFWLPGFISALAVIPLFFYGVGVATSREPTFLADPGFIATLVACSLGSSLTLYPLRRSRWILRALLAPGLAFILFLAVVVVLDAFFT